MQALALEDADVRYVPNYLFLPNNLFGDLITEVEWQQQKLHIYGKEVAVPRLTAWYGDPGCGYTYSGIRNEPKPWTDRLAKLRTLVSATCGVQFNSVLLNRYRSGNDSVAWHADDEPELGPEPTIASISLGSERAFQLKHKLKKHLKTSINLESGSLLIMAGATQKNWLHQIPKTSKPKGERINLTFRVIKS